MLNDLELIQYSLELNLYLSRTMMEHCIFIKAAINNKEHNYTKVIEEQIKYFQKALKGLVGFSNGKIRKEFIDSKQLVTDYTMVAEENSLKCFNDTIDSTITEATKNLSSGVPNINKENLEIVNDINQKMYNKLLYIIKTLNELNIDIKKENIVVNIHYPFFKHVIEETEILLKALERLINKVALDPSYVYISQYNHTSMMKDHSALIDELINNIAYDHTTELKSFTSLYKKDLKEFNNDITPYAIEKNNETFQKNTYEILNVNELLINEAIKDKITVSPLLMDHLLRETNHFLACFKQYTQK